MRADFPVVLDANVLAESALSDLFLRLSEEPRLLLPKWTKQIWEETHRTLTEKLKWDAGVAAARIAAAQNSFPEAMIRHHEVFIDHCKNDPKDRHILAAAIRANVETIVTSNAKHFKAEHLEPWGVVATHPDEYLKILFDHDNGVVIQVINDMAEKRRKPLNQMLSRIGAHAPSFSAKVGEHLGITVPPYVPEEYKNSHAD